MIDFLEKRRGLKIVERLYWIAYTSKPSKQSNISKHSKQDKHKNMKTEELLKELKGLEFTDLVDLYLEAKKGKYTTALDLLPAEAIELISSLEEVIKEATQ
jgi:hypothetical protein